MHAQCSLGAGTQEVDRVGICTHYGNGAKEADRVDMHAQYVLGAGTQKVEWASMFSMVWVHGRRRQRGHACTVWSGCNNAGGR